MLPRVCLIIYSFAFSTLLFTVMLLMNCKHVKKIVNMHKIRKISSKPRRQFNIFRKSLLLSFDEFFQHAFKCETMLKFVKTLTVLLKTTSRLIKLSLLKFMKARYSNTISFSPILLMSSFVFVIFEELKKEDEGDNKTQSFIF